MKNVRRDDWESLKPSVHGWGINDVNYKIEVKMLIKGKRVSLWACPYYRKWQQSIRRIYSDKFIINNPRYKDCTIDEEWKYLSNFIKWVDSQPNRDWIDCELDKDLLASSSDKMYSPATCVFISHTLNSFLIDNKSKRGQLMLGVSRDKRIVKGGYISSCNNPFKPRKNYVGSFTTELEAHLAWQAKKHEYACLLAEKQTDLRVAMVLRERYAPDKDWTKA